HATAPPSVPPKASSNVQATTQLTPALRMATNTNAPPRAGPVATISPVAPPMPQAHNTFWWWLIGLIVVAPIAGFLFLRRKSGVYQPNVPAMDPPLELARSRLTNGNWNG